MSILQELKASGFSFNKNLGQNFLIDEGFLQSVVSDLGLTKDDVITEIGTGAGTFTRCMAKNVNKVVTIEIDKRLKPILDKQFEDFKNIDLVFADALKMQNDEIKKLINVSNKVSGVLDKGRVGRKVSFKLVANIPYYITTPLIMKFIAIPECSEICVLVQEEVAKRICAKPGGKDYGALSVTCQSVGECRILKKVSRKCFVPVPNVDSAFVVIKKYSEANRPQTDSVMLEKLLKGLFSARRKTVLNGLCQTFDISKESALRILASLSITETARPENISVEKFIELVDVFYKKI